MSPVPAGHVWSLPTVGHKRHIRVDGSALCVPSLELGTESNSEHVMCREACKRCLKMVGEK